MVGPLASPASTNMSATFAAPPSLGLSTFRGTSGLCIHRRKGSDATSVENRAHDPIISGNIERPTDKPLKMQIVRAKEIVKGRITLSMVKVLKQTAIGGLNEQNHLSRDLLILR
jgi:hypothetical protein